MKAKDFEQQFEEGVDITATLDLSKATRTMQAQKRVNVDFPTWMIESLNRNQLALGISIFALSLAMVVWVDLFTFSKVVHLPQWADALPLPIFAPSFLVLFCLIPAAFGTDSFKSACQAIIFSLLVCPLAAVVAYALNPLNQTRFLPANAIFNYFWVIGFHCFIPALLVLMTRAIFGFACRNFHS